MRRGELTQDDYDVIILQLSAWWAKARSWAIFGLGLLGGVIIVVIGMLIR